MNKADYEHAGLEFVNGDRFSGGTGLPCAVDYFAWRTNTGVKPEFDGDIDIVFKDDSNIYYRENSDFYWVDGGVETGMVKWRPHLPKVEPKSPYGVDAHAGDVKLVYTKDMQDSESSVLGMHYIDGNGEECELVGENNSKYVFIGRIARRGAHHLHLSVCDKSECKPIQTEREKAIDNALELIGYGGDGEVASDLGILYDAGLLK